MLREFTCIICPNGCEIKVNIESCQIKSIDGNLCKKGIEYVLQEIKDPRRNIASSVLVINGEFPITSVRLTKPIPKNRIFDAMELIKTVSIEAPVKAGKVIISDILGLGSDVIVTKSVEKKPS